MNTPCRRCGKPTKPCGEGVTRDTTTGETVTFCLFQCRCGAVTGTGTVKTGQLTKSEAK